MAINYNYNNVGRYNTDGTAQDVFISGNTAYVADGSSGLQIVDVSDPASPSLLGSYDTPGTASGVYISGNYAYVADGSSGLQVIDVTDPANPTLFNTYSEGNYEKLSDLSDLNNTIYESNLPDSLVAVYDSTTMNWDVLDLDDPSSISSFFDDFFVNLLFPNASFPNALSASKDAYISGDYTYVADGASGLQIVSVDNLISSVLTGSSITATSYDTPDTASDVSVSGNFAYVADNSGLAIIDVSDPSAPTTAYIYEATKETSGVSVYGNYVYVTDGNAGLKTLNFIDGSGALDGTSSKELMLGSSGADTLKGFGGADVLAGGAESDKLIGGGGADTMVGGMGDDNLIGGGGSDVLIGVNPYEANPGAGERDILKGSAGADTFVLGDEMNVFYHDNGTTKAEGNAGRATIKDFDSAEGDIIQLNINSSYELVESNGSTKIYETSGLKDDYIAIVSGVTGLDLTNSSQFDYVGSVL